MEAALLSGVLKIAGDKLAQLIVDEFTSIMGVKKDLSELQHLFEEITRRLSRDSDPSVYWLKDLKDVAYDFDDLLNKVHLEAEKHKVSIDGGKHVMANWFCAKPKSGLSRLEMAHKIKKIKKRFAKIVKQRTDVNAIAMSSVVEHPIQRTNKIIGEISVLENKEEREVLGRGKVRREIISKLAEADTQEKISIVSIVGLGGSGKTTLAKYICQDSKIKEHFEVTFWVHVSQEFEVEKLIRKLFESVADNKLEVDSLQHMIGKISEKLSGKKFLLVLDDVWNENPHDWEQFEQRFKSGAPGSKILLTTRGAKVAEVVKSKEVVKLSSLSDDESWKLFQQSSGWAEEGLDAEFIEVGKEIVKKCVGVPLAIKSLAGVLSDKWEIREWRTLRDSSLLDESDIRDRVFGSLKLTYLQLPDDLKQCFLLCSIFPKGSCMYKDHLTSQWRAHGFVNPVNGSRQPEDIASDFFHSLLKVSFLQDLVEEMYTGRLSCKMHDLVHDLSRQILQDELVLTPKKITADHDQRCRYLSLALCTEKIDRKLFNKVRALYVDGGSFATDKPIKKGDCVRSVILKDLRDASFPMFTLNFQYLGYLTISNVGCTELPSAISVCWNLQALYIIWCPEFAVLPGSIGNLKRLRTLELSSDWLESLPLSIGDCCSLESLHLNNCREFYWIPDSIAKNEKLRILDIVNCHPLCQLPSESFKMLRNLQSINLTGCWGLEELPSSLGSNELHTLRLDSLSNLTILPQCITSLSSLKHLDLGYCQKLAELPEGVVNLQKLEVLNLEGCYKLRGLPAGFGKLTRLRKLGLFVIGDSSKHARISELGNLDMLSGILEIKGIRYVKDPGDAEKAYLKKKKNIQKLKLKWSSIETDAEEEVDMEQELAVLNNFEPPSGITELEIGNYQGLRWPCWMTEERHSSNLKNIVRDNQESQYRFPRLSTLRIADCPHLNEWPSLESLTLKRSNEQLLVLGCSFCPVHPHGDESELPPSCSSSNGVSSTLSLLKRLVLKGMTGPSGCSGWELLRHLPALESLVIDSCEELTQLPESMRSLTSLQELQIFACSGLCVLPELGELRSLQSLKIDDCRNLRELPEGIQHLTSLQTLRIFKCDALHQLPEGLGALRSLRSLWISHLPKLSCLPESMRGLTSVQHLHISNLPNLTCLPESMRGLTSLNYLAIWSCDALTVLPEWIGQLSALQSLQIRGCPGLTSLPSSIQRLAALQKLEIGDNPDLARRCKQGEGEDWHLISHIPNVYIN